MLTSFAITNQMVESKETFHRFDDLNILYKLCSRFGALIISTSLAAAVCYPLDTVKRRIQIEGMKGYKNTEVLNEFTYAN